MFADTEKGITGEMVERYKEDIKHGIQDQPNRVDLTFKSVGSEESPDRIVLDAQDQTGAKLPLLLSDGLFRQTLTNFNGTIYQGIRIPYGYSNSRGNSEIGTMEYAGNNKYIITAPCPSVASLVLLESRGIRVYSDNRPLNHRVMDNEQPGGEVQSVRCVYIYADRQNALGSLIRA